MLDDILVMKRDTLQEIVPSGRGHTMLMLLKMMNRQKNIFRKYKDYLDEEYVLISSLTYTISHEEK